MGSRNLADVAPTATTMALNAYIFGYGGHSIVTPHEALKQLWWTDQRIDAKVTRAFINSKLRESERKFLNRQLSFGESLTDDTYVDWILQRARRLFLILAEIGVPDQIFGCIDNSWDDEDLPLSIDNVGTLELSLDYDEALNRRFYDMQFVYLLRELKEGDHVDYGPQEHIPMEHDHTLPPAVSLQVWDRIHFPKRQNRIFMRRKYPFSSKQNGSSSISYESFQRDVSQAQTMSHRHIASVWASYTFEEAGYVLSDFVGEHTLQTFIAHRTAPQYLRVSAVNRPLLLCEWIYCLSDALAFIHHHGIAHGAVTPSNIIIDGENRIAFADIGSLRTFQRGKRLSKLEEHDYAAPEQQISETPYSFNFSPPTSSKVAFAKLRKRRSTRSSSSTYSSSDGSLRSNSISTTTPTSPNLLSHTSTIGFTAVVEESCSKAKSDIDQSSAARPMSPTVLQQNNVRPTTVETPASSIGGLQRDSLYSSVYATEFLVDLPRATTQQSDVFSFACIMLDIITFVLQGKLTEFVKHRSTTVRCLGNKSHYHVDSSFHGNSDRIHSWIDHLLHECDKHSEPIYRGFPSLLSLIRQMMAQNACQRPTALEVRFRLAEIMGQECGIEQVCCTGRSWNDSSALIKDKASMSTMERPSGLIVRTDDLITTTSAAYRTSPIRADASVSPLTSDARTLSLGNYSKHDQARGVISPSRMKYLVASRSQSQSQSTNIVQRAQVHSPPSLSNEWPLRSDSRMSMMPRTGDEPAAHAKGTPTTRGVPDPHLLENTKASNSKSWKRVFLRVHP